MRETEERGAWCQVDAHLDLNPKIRAAGHLGSAVFQFVLRMNALRGFRGHVPVGYLRPNHLAGVLMMTTDEARNGVTAAVTAELLWLDQQTDQVHIVGWTPEWGKQAKSNAERQAAFKQRKKLKTQLTLPEVTETRYLPLPGNESNAKRGEYIKSGASEDLVPRLVLVSPELPEYGGRADLEQGVVCQPVTPEPGRDRKPTTGSRNPAGDPRAAERSRLLRKLMGLHVKAFNAMREEFGLQVPAMQPVGDPTERALRELIDDQATLAGFEDSALHVLAVRESEVRRMRPPSLRYFGPTVWQPTAFATARTMEVGEDRSAPARDVRYGRAEPSSADVHARDALKGDRF